MSVEERKSYLDSVVLPESYVQRKIDEEKRRIENEQKQIGLGASFEAGARAGIAASVPTTEQGAAQSAKRITGTLDDAVDTTTGYTSGVVGG